MHVITLDESDDVFTGLAWYKKAHEHLDLPEDFTLEEHQELAQFIKETQDGLDKNI